MHIGDINAMLTTILKVRNLIRVFVLSRLKLRLEMDDAIIEIIPGAKDQVTVACSCLILWLDVHMVSGLKLSLISGSISLVSDLKKGTKE